MLSNVPVELARVSIIPPPLLSGPFTVDEAVSRECDGCCSVSRRAASPLADSSHGSNPEE